MKVSIPALRRVLIGLCLVLLSNAAVLGLLFQDKLHDLQTTFTDELMRRGAGAGEQQLGSIVIAAIDDASLKAYGRLESWDRRHYADLIRQLKRAGARVVAFDVAFLDSSPHDDDLAAAIAEAMAPRDGSPPLYVIMAHVGNGLPKHVAGKGLEFDSFQAMAPGVAKAKPIPAAVNVDLDGLYVRNLPLLYLSGEERYLPLPLVGASAFAGAFLSFPDKLEFDDDPYELHFGPYSIPTDQYFRMPIYFFTKPAGFKLGQNAFSVWRIAEGQVNPELLRNRLVFVGAYQATGLADDYPVPTSVNSKMDGVEIWANAAQSLISGKFVTPQPWTSTLATMLILSLVASVVFFRWGVLGWAASAVLGIGFTAIRYIQTAGNLIKPAEIGRQQLTELPNFAYVDAALALSSAVLFLYLFIQEQRRRSAVYSTFGRYVTPAVAQHLAELQAAGTLNLGGERRTATIMFGNLYPPHNVPADELLNLLNSYWDGIVRIVSQRGGTVNKFIGDHIMVMFNTPLELEDHAVAACRAAYEAVQWVKEKRASLPGGEATFGVGLNSGPLVAGNMGSQGRMEYTVLGDTVNTASRLSGVAKNDEVIISQATVNLLEGSGAKLEDRGEVRVKGKAEPVKIYAVLGFGEPGPAQILQPQVAATA